MGTATVFSPDSVRHLFAFCNTPSRCTRAVQRVGHMARRLPAGARHHAAALACLALAKALDAHGHMLREVQLFGAASPRVLELAVARDLELRTLGVR